MHLNMFCPIKSSKGRKAVEQINVNNNMISNNSTSNTNSNANSNSNPNINTNPNPNTMSNKITNSNCNSYNNCNNCNNCSSCNATNLTNNTRNSSSQIIVPGITYRYVTQDYTPKEKDELGVFRGDRVFFEYNQKDSTGMVWAHVLCLRSNRHGFVPSANLSTDPIKNQKIDNCNQRSGFKECTPFQLDDFGPFLVTHQFIAREENDCGVNSGEFVTVLNKDDDNWFWVRRGFDGAQGFVPSGYICDYDTVKSILNKGNSTNTMKSSFNHNDFHTYINQESHHVTSSNGGNRFK